MKTEFTIINCKFEQQLEVFNELDEDGHLFFMLRNSINPNWEENIWVPKEEAKKLRDLLNILIPGELLTAKN